MRAWSWLTDGPSAQRRGASRPPRPRPAHRRPNKGARSPGRRRRRQRAHLCRCSRRPDPPAPRGRHCGKMLRERTVRLQYGSRVEAVYVLGTHLWTDVYR